MGATRADRNTLGCEVHWIEMVLNLLQLDIADVLVEVVPRTLATEL